MDCYQISDQKDLIPLDYERAAEVARNRGAGVWLNLRAFENEELAEVLDKFEIKDLPRRLCLEARDRPGFYPLNQLIFMVLPIQVESEDHDGLEYVALLYRRDLLLTLQSSPARRLQYIAVPQESAGWLPNETIAGLVSAMLIVLSLDSLQRSAELLKMISALEHRMDREPNSVDMSEISEKRSELLTLEAIVSGQMPIVQSLLAIDRPHFDHETTREGLVCAQANLQATHRSLEWLEGRLDLLRSLLDMRGQGQMNRRLGRLTIISVIFMPITLLAGIWGMNFEGMPELTIPYGYPLALGSMFFIGVGLFIYFRRKGWFE
jgi:magnesium transporter